MAAVGKFKVFGPYLTEGGALESSISVYHYSAGTLTLKNVWSDYTKATTAAQPVASDSTGVVSFYADGLYKYVVKDSDANTLYSWDNVDDTVVGVHGEGSSIASASTLSLGNTYDYDYFHVTGTADINLIDGNQGTVILTFDGACTLVYSSSLLLMGGVDYLTTAGDSIQLANDGSDVWREVGRCSVGGYWRANHD